MRTVESARDVERSLEPDDCFDAESVAGGAAPRVDAAAAGAATCATTTASIAVSLAKSLEDSLTV